MNQNQIDCYLCEEPSCPGGPINNDFNYCQCPNCGDYWLEFILPNGKLKDPITKFKAACVAAERKLRNKDRFVIVDQQEDGGTTKINGHTYPSISINRLLSYYPQSPIDMLHRVLLNLNEMVLHPGDVIALKEYNPFILFSKDSTQMNNILSLLKDNGYITRGEKPENSFYVFIQPKGWEKIEELTKTTGADSNQAFVAMWFDPTMNDVFDNGIAPAIDEDCGIKPVKIDLKEFNDDVVDEIIAEIKRSRFVVADFTGGRQGVYFEAGFARGLGIPVIWLVQKDHLDDLHFDTRQFNHIVYDGPEDLRKKLANRIKATVL